MKLIIIFTFLLLNSLSLYTEDRDNIENLRDKTILGKGLYIETDLIGYIGPIYDFGFNLNLFYRFVNKIPINSFWNEVKTDIGIKNQFRLEQDTVSLFLNSSVSRYFTISGRASVVSYFATINRGFVGFTDKDNTDDFSLDNVLNGSKNNATALELEITPTFKLAFLKDIFINTGLSIEAGLSIKYAYTDASDYYYDYDLLLLRGSNDVSYKLDTRLVFDMTPFGVGIQYTLSYIQNTELLGQTIGAYINYDHYFIGNRLYINSIGYVGQYITQPNLSGKLYFTLIVRLGYKLM